jgi:hypothetical protein
MVMGRGFDSIFTAPNNMPKPNTRLVPNPKEDKIGEDAPAIPNILLKAYPIGPSGLL